MDRIKITEYKTRGGMNVGAAFEKLYNDILKGDTDEAVSTAFDLYRTSSGSSWRRRRSMPWVWRSRERWLMYTI